MSAAAEPDTGSLAAPCPDDGLAAFQVLVATRTDHGWAISSQAGDHLEELPVRGGGQTDPAAAAFRDFCAELGR